MVKSAYQNDKGEWVYPQVYYRNEKAISKEKLLEQIANDPLVREAIKAETRIGSLIEQAKKQRCVYGYNASDAFYGYYKPQIGRLVGWEAVQKSLRTVEHYDAVYDAIYDLLPADEIDLYQGGIMPNGKYSPSMQERYGCEYP